MAGKSDRLSALLQRFELSVRPSSPEDANLFFLKAPDGPKGFALRFHVAEADPAVALGAAELLFSAQVDWGGLSNPLLAALPAVIEEPLGSDSDIAALASLMIAESQAGRCGSDTVLLRLGEALFVRLMRHWIEFCSIETGLLGGLADPRLSRALVAMHEQPGTDWRAETLAREAGLSVSRFGQLFRQTMGQSPLAYLRRWRLLLARKDIELGVRVQTVAERYCYGSTEALSRAVTREFGHNPRALRHSAQDQQIREQLLKGA